MALLINGLIATPLGAENAAAPAAPANQDNTAQDLLRSYLQVQEQLHATQMAVEGYRKQADEAATRNAQALADNTRILTERLKGLEESLASERTREMQALHSSNQVMLIVAAVLACIGFLGIMVMAWFQSRALSRFTDLSSNPPAFRGLPPIPAVAALGPATASVVSTDPVEHSNRTLLEALERLEKRIYQFENLGRPSLADKADSQTEAGPKMPRVVTPAEAVEGNGNGTHSVLPFVEMLKRGQALLDEGKAPEALACFEEVLETEPDHTEALVKKGAVLERLRRVDEAIACYDRAIAADNSLTVAYLHKGGLYNRLERFTEALECYEKALRTQEKRES